MRGDCMKKLSSIIDEIKYAYTNKELTGSIYSITLILLLVISLIIYFLYLPSTLNWMIEVIIITDLIHFFLYSLVAYTIESNKEKSFVQQYNKGMEKYEKTNDPYMLHDELSAIRFLPVKQETKNAFNLSMSTALYRTNRPKEALNYLDIIKTDNQNLLNIVKEQRKLFESKTK